MLRLLLAFFLLAGFLPASEVDLSSPESAVRSYYGAIHEGDMDALQRVMTAESYADDVKIYALSVALKDPAFHEKLKSYDTDPEARRIIEAAVSGKLRKREPKTLSSFRTVPNGTGRAVVTYLESGVKRQLYLSTDGTAWKVDYRAGRKTD